MPLEQANPTLRAKIQRAKTESARRRDPIVDSCRPSRPVWTARQRQLSDAQGREARPDRKAPTRRPAPRRQSRKCSMADAASFTEWQTGQRWPVAMEGGNKSLEAAYLKTRRQPASAVARHDVRDVRGTFHQGVPEFRSLGAGQ